MASILFKWFFLSFCLFTFPAKEKTDNHPVYISVTEIEHNAKEHTLEISCKIFATDLEAALTKANHTKTDLFDPKDKALVKKQISDYITQHLGIKADGRQLVLEMVGFEREEEALWTYLQVTNVNTPPKKVDIIDKLLYDTFDKQINLVHVTVNGTRKSTKLDNPQSAWSFQF